MSAVTFPEFLNMSLALWMEENLRIQPQKDFSTLREIITPSDARVEVTPRREDVKQQNEDAMAALKAMMSGVKKPSR